MRDFKSYTKIKAETMDVYAAITNPFTIELWSGHPAKLELVEGSEFEMYDGDICGKIIRFIEDKELVQQWYFGDQKEESLVVYKIFGEGDYSTLEVRHSNIPDEDYDDIVYGWKEFFISPIKRFLEIE